MRQREEERRTLHGKLQANQEEIAQVHQEVSTSVGKQKDPFALRQYIAMVIEAEKARTENAQNWVQVKSLMRFMKQQQAESDRQERWGQSQTLTTQGQMFPCLAHTALVVQLVLHLVLYFGASGVHQCPLVAAMEEPNALIFILPPPQDHLLPPWFHPAGLPSLCW